jgi:hypothetical protein
VVLFSFIAVFFLGWLGQQWVISFNEFERCRDYEGLATGYD